MLAQKGIRNGSDLTRNDKRYLCHTPDRHIIKVMPPPCLIHEGHTKGHSDPGHKNEGLVWYHCMKKVKFCLSPL